MITQEKCYVYMNSFLLEPKSYDGSMAQVPISHILAGIQIKTLSTFSHYHIPSKLFLGNPEPYCGTMKRGGNFKRQCLAGSLRSVDVCSRGRENVGCHTYL